MYTLGQKPFWPGRNLPKRFKVVTLHPNRRIPAHKRGQTTQQHELYRRFNMKKNGISRRAFAAGALASTGVLAACGNGVGSRGSATIDARVSATLYER